jgi:2-phospho-L-lactate transferase/gluconeogenesis factor (CofD/UPF0052 family)
MIESMTPFSRTATNVNVVLFSGGRGSTVLSKQLINNPRISLTLAINGYDDGASTGEVRRFLEDSLGPSDFRKNASRMARELQSCGGGFIELLDLRFPDACMVEQAVAALQVLAGKSTDFDWDFIGELGRRLAGVEENAKAAIARKIQRFEQERVTAGRPFSFSDCSLGNLVFAGCYLDMARNFNAAIADYCALLNLPAGLIENVTDGTNAQLVALDHDHRLLGSEAEIVDAKRRNHIADIYLIDHILTPEEVRWLASLPFYEQQEFFRKCAQSLPINPRLLERISAAHLIVYSPGTQHSSLYPSYLTPGLGAAIARNLTAIKLLITNIQEDAEIADSSAVDIIERAVHYLKEKNSHPIPTPCLITHYLINDPARQDQDSAYVPLGQLETLEDPRLVRIGNYEDGITGRHDAAKILTPFVESILKRGESYRIAVLLLDTDSLNKITQTILEMSRGGILDLPVSVTVFYNSPDDLDPAFTSTLPFPVYNVFKYREKGAAAFMDVFLDQRFDYLVLFESSGMYNGEDLVAIASILSHGRLDAVWGSRRLSVKDIRESYKLRYRHNIILGAMSYVGSHVLSLLYLFLYGRYISDTLSGVRAVRSACLRNTVVDITHKCLNQHILSLLLRERAEIFEAPVRFFPISPGKVKRTTVLDGVQSILTVLWWRIKSVRSTPTRKIASETAQQGFESSSPKGK